MSAAPSGDFLLPHEREKFVEQFSKDLEFFQLFFLLINKSWPIKKIDLVWAKDGPAGRVGLRRLMGTMDALNSPCSRLVPRSDKAPDPHFCELINDFGRREAESCGISDRAAEQRVRETGKPEVYRCHARLIDIAVPVICDGEHIATLLTGQVLSEPPSGHGFVQITKDVRRLDYIDLAELEKAYWQVPQVSEKEIQATIEVLQLFAQHLANSWKRLSDAVREQQRKTRELQLCRKEFAHLLLEGESRDRTGLRDVAQRIGLKQFPNRVLVVKLESEDEYSRPLASYDLAFTTALQAIEEVCDKYENTFSAYLFRRGVCVLLHDADAQETPSAQGRARALARKILGAISARCDLRARVGIGNARVDWRRLGDSYQEACMAAAADSAEIALYRQSAPSAEELATSIQEMCRSVAERRVNEVRLQLNALPTLAKRHIPEGASQLSGHRQFFSAALDSLCAAVHRLGADAVRVSELRAEGTASLDRSANVFGVHEAFLQSAEEIVNEVRRLYTGKRDRVVERACRIIDRHLEGSSSALPISIGQIASSLGYSSGHLSRLFRQTKGITFERYLMLCRVERAKRLLLEPTNNVSMVAERCGFSDPTYFARVFRMIAGCPPSEYAKHPQTVDRLGESPGAVGSAA